MKVAIREFDDVWLGRAHKRYELWASPEGDPSEDWLMAILPTPVDRSWAEKLASAFDAPSPEKSMAQFDGEAVAEFIRTIREGGVFDAKMEEALALAWIAKRLG